jgi:hypothetical protein
VLPLLPLRPLRRRGIFASLRRQRLPQYRFQRLRAVRVRATLAAAARRLSLPRRAGLRQALTETRTRLCTRTP